MNDFQHKVQLLNNLSYRFVRTFTFNSNKVSDTFNFSDFIYTIKLNGFYCWKNVINHLEKQ